MMRFLLCLCLPVMVAAQDLEVKGLVAAPLKLTLRDLELMPHQTVKAKEHDGTEATFSGVPLFQILQKAGVPFGDQMRGPVLAQYVLITAADGYRVVFALPELIRERRMTRCCSVTGGMRRRWRPARGLCGWWRRRSAEGAPACALGAAGDADRGAEGAELTGVGGGRRGGQDARFTRHRQNACGTFYRQNACATA